MAKGDAKQSAQAATDQTAALAPQWRNEFQGNLQPTIGQFGYNYGRGGESDYGDRTDIMNRYREIAGGGMGGGGGAGGGGVGYTGDMSYLTSPGTYTPFLTSHTDPFKSYAGYEGFSNTGGFNSQDVADLRARGISPIRAAYANAEQGVNRQRALGGGYSPNAVAAMGKMAREQGQGMSDAVQNVNAGIIGQRNANKLAGLGGMSGIEQQRLQAEMAEQQFNAQQQAAAQAGNIGSNWNLQQANSAIQGRNLNAQQQVAGANAAAAGLSSQQDMQARLAALGGMTNLYGTTPGQAQLFGNQLLQGIGQQGQYDVGMMNALTGANRNQIAAGQLPGTYDTTMNRVGQISGIAAPWASYLQNRGGGNQPLQSRNTGAGSIGYLPMGQPSGIMT